MKKALRAAWLVLFALVGFSHLVFATQTIQLSDSPSRISIINEDQSGLSMRVEIGAIDLVPVTTDEGEFHLATVKGFGRSHAVGEPNLPVAYRLVSIPYGCELTVDIESSTVEEFSLADMGITSPLIPVQPSVSKSEDPADVPFEINYAVYETAGYYAQERARAETLGEMRSVRVARIAVAPVEYNPTENTIRVYRDITVRINYLHPDWAETYDKQIQHYSPFFEPVYQRLANYRSPAGDKADLVKRPVKYVIIADPAFEAQLQPFIEWKTQKGFTVVEAYIDDIGSSNTAIKSYLQTLYNNGTPEDPAPSFVLFVGDDNQIQAFSGTTGSHISDLYFCEFTGDVFPEIYYGRFSAQTPALLQPQIDKTLEYEKYLMPDPSYLENVTLIAGVDGTHAPTYGNGQINYGADNYFNVDHDINANVWLYPASDGSGVNTAIIQTMNTGIAFANYTAHCGHSSWSNPYINTGDLQDLTNIHKYFLAIGNCCQSNTFGDDESTPCWGEVFLQEANKGGIGYIGGSNSTYWDEDYWWGVGYGPVVGAGPTYEQTGLGAYDGVFHDHGEPDTSHYVTNDAIIFCGNLAVSESGSSRDTYYWEIYHLMGDPSVTSYIGVPTLNAVVHDDALVIGATELIIQAAPASYIGISIDGVLYGAGYVDASGSVTITLDPIMVPGMADIVVTAQNKQPYIGTIQVVAPEGPYLVYEMSDVDDFGGGNGNGLVDYGETVILGTGIKNVGPDMAYSVEATLSSADPNVTITDGSESFGDVTGDNGTSYVSDAFTFTVSSSTPDGHSLPFTLTMTDSNDSVWSSSFSLVSHAPSIGYLAVTISDAAGNNNGVFDPGETVDLVVAIENSGSGEANAVTATLSETDTYVDILDASGSYADLAPSSSGENETDVFTASADAGCPRGHEMTFTVTVSAANGFSSEVAFSVIIGDRVVFFADDFAFDQGWTGLGGSGEWTIGVATGGAGSDTYGGADPAIDHSPTDDNMVLGNDLTSGSGGDYNSGLSSTYWVTSPVIDCGDFNGCILSLYRWLGVESSTYDHAYLEVNNGGSWVQLFANSSTTDESSWSLQEYDVASIADSSSTFQIRFGIGGTDGSMNYCGWNIDDLELKGYGERSSAQMALESDEVIDSLVPGDESVSYIRVYNLDPATILRVRFSSTVSWLTCSADQQYVDPEDQLDFPVTFVTAGMAPGDYSGLVTYSCNDYSNQYDTITVSLHLYAPVVQMVTTSVEASTESGGMCSEQIVLDNIGPGRLEYGITCQMFDGKSGVVLAKSSPRELLGYRLCDGDKSDATAPYYGGLDRSAGGPDVFGYSWIDSDDAAGPVYEWVDVSTVGTVVTLGDDTSVGPLPMGIGFPFYDQVYTEIYINSNGLLTFGSGSTSRTGQDFPDATAPNNLIALLWDDLDPPENGLVYYYADAANDRFIVTYEDVRFYKSPDGTGSLTFQAILYGNGDLVLQYATLDAGEFPDGLTGLTIGIENADGSDGLNVVYNAPYLHDNLAVQFTAARWLSVSPAGGTLEPYTSDTLTVSFDATELVDGEYHGQLTLNCNDPIMPTMTVPVTLMIASYVCGDANGDGAVDVADAVYTINYVFKSGPASEPIEAADANGDGEVDVADAVYTINYVFKAGPEPLCP